MRFAQLNMAGNLVGIQSEVTALLTDHWLPHVNEKGYQGNWSVLPLRCADIHKNSHPILQGFAIQQANGWADLPALKQSSHLSTWVRQFQCPIRSIRLMRLAAGSHISPHQDPGLEWDEGEARLHLPVFSNSAVEFKVGGKIVPMSEGELWYINASQIHEVSNQGPSDRINLVLDVQVTPWLAGLILHQDSVS